MEEKKILSSAEQAEMKQIYGQFVAGDGSGELRWYTLSGKMAKKIARKMKLEKSAYPGDREDLECDLGLKALSIAKKIQAGKSTMVDPCACVWESLRKHAISKVQGKKDSFRLDHLPEDYDAPVEASRCSEAAERCEKEEAREFVVAIAETAIEREIAESDEDVTTKEHAEKLGKSVAEIREARSQFRQRVEAALSATGEEWKMGRAKQGRKPSKKTSGTSPNWPTDSPLKGTETTASRGPVAPAMRPRGN